MALFKTEALSFRYPEADYRALNHVNIQIDNGEFVLLMGKTGSGKSTLLKLLVAELAPHGEQSGSIIRTDAVGYVAQNTYASFVCELVRGELAFALENQGLDNDTITMKIGEIASFFNITHLLERKISTLSGGERVAVAVAAAMIRDVSAIILDEPTSQLDSKSAYELVNILKRVNDELGVAVIISSHQSEGIMDKCDRLLVLEKGSVLFDGSPDMCDDAVLDFYPLSARLFSERPLTVKQAAPFAARLAEKPEEKSTITEEIISVRSVSFAYGKRERDVLDNLSFKAYKGKIHCIIGANGSGKTTLLKLIAGIKKPISGKIKTGGKVAYLPQNPQYLFTRDTVSQEIDEQTARRFGLADYLSQHPYDLSGGQQQRLALAMLSRLQYDILLLDEPSKALDVFYKRELTAYLKDLGKTVIIVSHDLNFVADTADYVSFLSDGIITLNGERRAVLSSLDFYTSELRRITKNHLSSAVSQEDLL